MRMFNVFKRLSPDVTTSPLAKASTPDEMIAGAIVKSFATEFDQWTVSDPYNAFEKGEVVIYSRSPPRGSSLVHRAKTITITREYDDTRPNPERYSTNSIHVAGGIVVNGEKLNKAMSDYVVSSWNKMYDAAQKAKKAAEQAKKVMEENERKWNLVESLVGLKRNEHGALVPIHTEESIKTCTSSCCQPKGDLSCLPSASATATPKAS